MSTITPGTRDKEVNKMWSLPSQECPAQQDRQVVNQSFQLGDVLLKKSLAYLSEHTVGDKS